MKVLIVIITNGKVEPECLKAALNQDYDDYSIMVSIEKNKTEEKRTPTEHLHILHNRNSSRAMALASEADYFLLIDSDVVLPKNAVSEFVKQVSGNKKFHILGGWYQHDKDSWSAGKWVADNTIFSFIKPEKSIIRVDKVDLGCIFLSRKVLSEIPFRHTDVEIKGIDGKKYLACECLLFAIDAQDKKYQLFMDGSVICRHIKKIKKLK